MKTITLNDCGFTRLTFRRKDSASTHRWVYDVRGYQFVHYPVTGDILTNPKESTVSHIDTGILFDFYDDYSGNTWFAFYESDCFDPPLKLINARTWEDAYDAYLDEFATPVTHEEVADMLKDIAYDLIKTELAAGSIVPWDQTQKTIKEWFDELPEEEQASWLKSAENQLGNDGQITVPPNSRAAAETGWVWCENIQGFELELVKAELIP